MRRPVPVFLLLALLPSALLLVACGKPSTPIATTVAIGVYRAQAPQGLERQAAGPGWQAVTFGGKHYLVADTAIFTERNIVSARAIDGRPGALEVVLDEAGREAWSEHTGTRASLNQPVGIRVRERWASFTPVLARATGGRVTLLGLTRDEIEAILGQRR